MCDIGSVVQHYVLPLMQLAANDVPEGYVELNTTKCLSTAVMFLFLFLGSPSPSDRDSKSRGVEGALWHARRCNVPRVRRLNADKDSSLANIDLLAHDVLSPGTGRTLYYVMITDGDLHRGTEKRVFPGHVFVVEKTLSRRGVALPRFNLYQSYIDNYDFAGHAQRAKGTGYSVARMRLLLQGLREMFSGDATWSPSTVRFWKRLTHVDSTEWVSFSLKGAVFFCFSKAETTACMSNLRKYATSKASEIEALIKEKPHRADEVYGDAALYAKSSHAPLTNGQMLEQLRELLGKI
jgi:hypothetical protein